VILLAVLHIAGTLVALAYIADHHSLERGAQLPIWALAAASWPLWIGIRLLQVTVREYRALGR
jgi:hypothetical protein